jgi:coenzyme F420 hydrogenase subunit beta
MMRKFRSIDEVVAWRACVGCGACAYLSGGVRMVDIPGAGNRPVRCGATRVPEAELLAGCPGAGTLVVAPAAAGPGISAAVVAATGPTLEVWEGHATDPEIRFAGASGGALTALAAYCLEHGGMDGVLHVGRDPDNPVLNKTVMSRTRAELQQQSGSRYSPTSVCAGLHLVDAAAGPCAFIGQPSEVAGLRKIQALRPHLHAKVGVVMSFFCAGTPPTEATTELLRANQIDPGDVSDLRYRGRGWPGSFAVWRGGGGDPVLEMSYAESWAFLQRFRPWAVHIWPDGSGEQADITCGDPWHRPVKPNEPGSSLVIARTQRGSEIVRAAIHAGYLTLVPLAPEKLLASQENLTRKKAAVWGRLAAMRLLGIPTPRHRGYSLLRLWLDLPLSEKFGSLAGTAKRLVQRRYWKPEALPRELPARPAADATVTATKP